MEMSRFVRSVLFAAVAAGGLGAFGAWYDNPLVDKRIDLMVKGWVDPHYMNKSADDRYIGLVMQAEDSSLQPTLIYDARTETVKRAYEQSSSGPGANWKGCAVSSDLGLMVTGSGLSQNVAALKLVGTTYGGPGTNAYPVAFSEGCGDSLDFGTGSTFLYANNATTKNLVCCYTVGTLTEVAGNTLTLAKSQASTLVNRIRSLSVHRVNGRELVYYGEGDGGATAKVCAMDVTDETWTESDLTASIALPGFTGDIMVVKLSNENTSAPILYVLSDDGKLAVCQLAADGKSIMSVIKVFSSDALRAFCGVKDGTTSKFRNFEVTKNGQTAYLLHGDGLGTGLVKLRTPAVRSFNILAESAAERIELGDEVVYRFTGNGKLHVAGSGTIDVLLVGGGGGGGRWEAWNNNNGGGGGGAGGLVYTQSFAVVAGSYDVVVGAGGAGGGCNSTKLSGCAGNGGNSSVFGLTAYGGGGGAHFGQTIKGADGGSGGGGVNGWSNPDPGTSSAIHASEGNRGNGGSGSTHAYSPGGGGGAGEPGGCWYGGKGVEIDIVGTNVWYAGGGCGHSYTRGADECIAHHFGGGGYRAAGENGLGGGGATSCNGGSGVVIVRFTPTEGANAATADIGGGDETKALSDGKALVFNESGDLTVSEDCVLEVLLVGGGGGGGTGVGGGGGGGGVVYRSAVVVPAGTYPIQVGAGGAGGANGGDATTGTGSNGGHSSALGFIAYGGGGGARHSGNIGKSGATGGGSTHKWDSDGIAIPAGTAIYGEQGYDGSHGLMYYAPGGGGGAGGPATDNDTISPATPGSGGPGVACAISGETTWYGGGGTGWRDSSSVARCSAGIGGGGNGCKGTDGLGGGGSAYEFGGYAGGSGVVVVRLRRTIANPVLATKASGGVTSSPKQGVRVHTFTANGTFTMPCDGTVDILLVGGGGGAGSIDPNNTDGRCGGGGGAGGLVYQRGVSVKAGSYAITIGAGGTGGARVNKTNGTNGGNTTALGFTAYGGGGGGGASSRTDGKDGGSGGGGTSGWDNKAYGGKAKYASAWNWGNAGGDTASIYRPAGGGGAGAMPILSAISYQSGGNGLEVDITGTGVYYAGGGSGYRGSGTKSDHPAGLGGGGNGTKGTDGLGGGGSGGCNGGSGVVIIRYEYTPPGMLFIAR